MYSFPIHEVREMGRYPLISWAGFAPLGVYLRVASPKPLGKRWHLHIAEKRGTRADRRLGPAHTNIQFVTPSGPQAFRSFFLSFLRATRIVPRVMGETSSELSSRMEGIELETSFRSSSSMPPPLSAPLLTCAVNRETASATCSTFVHLIFGFT